MSNHLPDPASAPELFEGVLSRRILAWLVDTVIIFAIAMAVFIVGLIIGVVTLGIGLIALPFILPIAVFAYYAMTLGSPARSTVGMRMFDLVLTPARSKPLDGWAILIHPIIFWVTIWFAWIAVLLPLFTPRRQMLHDLVTGTLMLRRSPMERFWRGSTVRSA
jgi:uncharacterized RDD family membrane protein YckC